MSSNLKNKPSASSARVAGGVRRRTVQRGGATRSVGSGKGADTTGQTLGGSTGGSSLFNGMNFYTDETPGLNIGPTLVLMLSLCFIVFVVLLHIWGKVSR
eukprot:CAMPEP_0168590428 /NCGR_PEP_ID=MMETSP0420-20121227/6563_1 /TAXON_ID=498008 /ORGANISM="Pessonella sp." /LENGTH=99 /DNA_ID=CAMNT_0008626087 /DNA_START=17 /DNA_END=316 /DNA_ORIENTATION=-